ncbi:hypothetical protein DFH28DRAFT_1216627 [Melampsora americana]|nr:hypothetical protein DFH28DRAFT_1216627 [Melampsora americana]
MIDQSTMVIATWDQLYTIASHKLYPQPSATMRTMLAVMTVLSPLTGLLFVVSGVKRTMRNGGWWLCRIDSGGYIAPNPILMITFFATLYTILDTMALICLQINLSTYVKWYTLALHFSSLVVLFCFGWTKVWCFAYATPPSVFRLKQGNTSTEHDNNFKKIMGPKLFNSFIIALYIIPFASIAPFAIMAVQKLREIELGWIEYTHTHHHLVQTLSQPNNPAIAQLAQSLQNSIFLRLKSLVILGDGILKNVRIICGILFGLDMVFLACSCVSTWRIMSALWSQVTTLRECAHRRREARTMGNMAHTIDLLKRRASSTMTVPDPKSTKSLIPWLPPLRRGVEVTSAVWSSRLFQDGREDWEKCDEVILNRRYNHLSRYSINVLWQAILMVLTAVLYTTLNLFVVLNVLDIPKRNNLCDLNMIVMLWGNLIWNCGLGTILGIISCLVAFSSQPESLPDTNTRPLRNSDEDW